MATGLFTYAEILAKVDALTTEARMYAVTPVLIQDELLTPEERETLAELSVKLSDIINTVEELRNNNS